MGGAGRAHGSSPAECVNVLATVRFQLHVVAAQARPQAWSYYKQNSHVSADGHTSSLGKNMTRGPHVAVASPGEVLWFQISPPFSPSGHHVLVSGRPCVLALPVMVTQASVMEPQGLSLADRPWMCDWGGSPCPQMEVCGCKESAPGSLKSMPTAPAKPLCPCCTVPTTRPPCVSGVPGH